MVYNKQFLNLKPSHWLMLHKKALVLDRQPYLWIRYFWDMLCRCYVKVKMAVGKLNMEAVEKVVGSSGPLAGV